MTDDQVERLITAVERVAAVNEEQLQFHRQNAERMEARMASGPPPEVIERMQERMASGPPPEVIERIEERVRSQGPPPEIMRMVEALEHIASALSHRGAPPV